MKNQSPGESGKRSRRPQFQTRRSPRNNSSNPIKSFTEAKKKFDNLYGNQATLPQSLVPVDGKYITNVPLRDTAGGASEEYYKWQFIYGLINSGLYSKDYICAEVWFPKGSKSSAPLEVDACIFDSKEWLQYYLKWRKDPNDNYSLEFLRNHCIAAIEFKRGKDSVERTFSTQLKPAMKESDAPYVLGVLYDAGRLYLFQRKDNQILRYDESKNISGKAKNTEALSLDLTDSYQYIPSFDQLVAKVNKPSSIDRTNRTIHDLDTITSRASVQVKDALGKILKTLDKHGLANQRGYGILIQTLALKIFDEKRNEHDLTVKLRFYVKDSELNFISLHEKDVQNFVERMNLIYEGGSTRYQSILKNLQIDWKNEDHIRVVQSIVENFQDFSFVRSQQSDLYQLVFHNFALPFQKGDKAQFLTPLQLIDFLARIVNPRGNETVCDPCVGIADFLSLSYINSKSTKPLNDANLWGVDIDDNMLALAQLNMLLNGDGNAHLLKASDKGSILYKIRNDGELIPLIPELHKEGKWDDWKDKTKLMKFRVILTNPPFGRGRTYEVERQRDRDIIEMYETYWRKGKPKRMDLGVVFLENAYRILAEHGRMGIVLSNSIASNDEWKPITQWFMERMRIVAIFDLPPNVFAETGVNTTLIVAYKPSEEELENLKNQNYSIFTRDIKKVGYEKKTAKRNVKFEFLYKLDPKTFEVVIDENGAPVLDEEFTDRIKEFQEWAKSQEETLQRLFTR